MNFKGQSTVEYLLLVTAVIAVILFFTTNQNNGFQNKLLNVFNQTTDTMVNVSNRLAGTDY